MYDWLISVRRSWRNIDYDDIPMDPDLVNQLVSPTGDLFSVLVLLGVVQVVGSIEQTGDADDSKPEKEADSASDSKNGAKPMDVDKGKTKRKLYVGQELEFRRDHMEVISPMKDGTVTDWDIVDNIWNHAFRAAELMFENYKVPALFLAKNAVLTSFASGRATSLVVDSGGGSTVVSAVHDGFVLQKSVVTSPVGGEFLTDCMMKSLESKGIVIRPRYSFKKKEISPGEYKIVDLDLPNTTESYRLYCMRAIASDIKESVCRVPDTFFDEVAYANVPTTSYELPDGQTIEVGADRFKVPDILFNPSLSQESPQAARVKVMASGNSVERRFSVWIGGSILASLGSFQQMWFSRAEYEEHGVSYIQRKCP
ncbi:Actin-related protein 4 [Dichanthelium oligosanthes]|uniref:Actin-related protein 4 n=1 Tax=Dichanthelium oligosanthes TaxID=888268 RepID=A0A1E5V455_9POAL|nr:Actin-related protein 4 [Dichanthelium oligosanthes]